MARVRLDEMKDWYDEFSGAIDHPRVRQMTELKIEEIKSYLTNRIGRDPEPIKMVDKVFRRFRQPG